ncbi:MAG: hypothetical protein K2P41_06060 [Lachnospiraceae bacterium]|nr:hypothetical protein [Lachnospiraceae bacterium]
MPPDGSGVPVHLEEASGGVRGCLLRLPEREMEAYIQDVVRRCRGFGGFAFGSGNSIPDYVPVEQYQCMVRCIRRLRGEDV